MIGISIVNKSTAYKDADLPVLANALQIQVTRDLYPIWGFNARIYYTPSGSNPSLDHWTLFLMDNATQAGELGVHDVSPAGLPLGQAFVETTLADGSSIERTVSHELCLDGETIVPLLDGTKVQIKDLVGREKFWVYSCKEDGSLRPGLAHSARMTGHREVVTVTMDDGSTVKCTADHPFLMRDGSYRKAASLANGDSLMPLYRRLEPIDPNNKDSKEYEQVYIPSVDGWVFTHRMVVPYCSSGYVRHHADFNRFNNSPDNIQVLTWKAHQEIHAAHIDEHRRAFEAKGTPRKISPENRRKMGERGKASLVAYNKSEKHKSDMQRFYTKEEREKRGAYLGAWARSEAGRKRLAELAGAPGRREVARQNITAYNKSEKHRAVATVAGKKAMDLLRSNPEAMEKMNLGRRRSLHARWHEARGLTEPTCSLCVGAVNHKVVSIESCGTADVYDLTVDRYHNFAIGSGVFVHNCEMGIDPHVNLSAQVDSILYAYENCDAVEADADGYAITIPAGWVGAGTSVPVSSFVTPDWFQPGSNGPFDFRGPTVTGKLTAPLQLSPGGYISFLDLNNLNAGWQQTTARTEADAKMRARPYIGSRRALRKIPLSQRIRSTYTPGTQAIAAQEVPNA
jgi:hypothetical protein